MSYHRGTVSSLIILTEKESLPQFLLPLSWGGKRSHSFGFFLSRLAALIKKAYLSLSPMPCHPKLSVPAPSEEALGLTVLDSGAKEGPSFP